MSRIWRQDYLFCIIVKDLVLHLILLSTKNGDFSIRYSVFCASCALSKVVLGYPVKFCTYTTSQSSVLVCGSPLSENSSWWYNYPKNYFNKKLTYECQWKFNGWHTDEKLCVCIYVVIYTYTIYLYNTTLN